MSKNNHGIAEALKALGIEANNHGACTGTTWLNTKGESLTSTSSTDGNTIATVTQGTADDYETIIKTAHAGYLQWRTVPAPARGEVVQIGRAHV